MKMQVTAEGTTKAELLKKLHAAIAELGGTAKATPAAAAPAKPKSTPKAAPAEVEEDFTSDDAAADEDFETNDEEESSFDEEPEAEVEEAPKKPAAKPAAGKAPTSQDVNNAAKACAKKFDSAKVRNIFKKVSGVTSITEMDKKFFAAVIKALNEAKK